MPGTLIRSDVQDKVPTIFLSSDALNPYSQASLTKKGKSLRKRVLSKTKKGNSESARSYNALPDPPPLLPSPISYSQENVSDTNPLPAGFPDALPISGVPQEKRTAFYPSPLDPGSHHLGAIAKDTDERSSFSIGRGLTPISSGITDPSLSTPSSLAANGFVTFRRYSKNKSKSGTQTSSLISSMTSRQGRLETANTPSVDIESVPFSSQIYPTSHGKRETKALLTEVPPPPLKNSLTEPARFPSLSGRGTSCTSLQGVGLPLLSTSTTGLNPISIPPTEGLALSTNGGLTPASGSPSPWTRTSVSPHLLQDMSAMRANSPTPTTPRIPNSSSTGAPISSSRGGCDGSGRGYNSGNSSISASNTTKKMDSSPSQVGNRRQLKPLKASSTRRLRSTPSTFTNSVPPLPAPKEIQTTNSNGESEETGTLFPGSHSLGGSSCRRSGKRRSTTRKSNKLKINPKMFKKNSKSENEKYDVTSQRDAQTLDLPSKISVGSREDVGKERQWDKECSPQSLNHKPDSKEKANSEKEDLDSLSSTTIPQFNASIFAALKPELQASGSEVYSLGSTPPHLIVPATKVQKDTSTSSGNNNNNPFPSSISLSKEHIATDKLEVQKKGRTETNESETSMHVSQNSTLSQVEQFYASPTSSNQPPHLINFSMLHKEESEKVQEQGLNGNSKEPRSYSPPESGSTLISDSSEVDLEARKKNFQESKINNQKLLPMSSQSLSITGNFDASYTGDKISFTYHSHSQSLLPEDKPLLQVQNIIRQSLEDDPCSDTEALYKLLFRAHSVESSSRETSSPKDSSSIGVGLSSVGNLSLSEQILSEKADNLNISSTPSKDMTLNVVSSMSNPHTSALQNKGANSEAGEGLIPENMEVPHTISREPASTSRKSTSKGFDELQEKTPKDAHTNPSNSSFTVQSYLVPTDVRAALGVSPSTSELDNAHPAQILRLSAISVPEKSEGSPATPTLLPHPSGTTESPTPPLTQQEEATPPSSKSPAPVEPEMKNHAPSESTPGELDRNPVEERRMAKDPTITLLPDSRRMKSKDEPKENIAAVDVSLIPENPSEHNAKGNYSSNGRAMDGGDRVSDGGVETKEKMVMHSLATSTTTVLKKAVEAPAFLSASGKPEADVHRNMNSEEGRESVLCAKDNGYPLDGISDPSDIFPLPLLRTHCPIFRPSSVENTACFRTSRDLPENKDGLLVEGNSFSPIGSSGRAAGSGKLGAPSLSSITSNHHGHTTPTRDRKSSALSTGGHRTSSISWTTKIFPQLRTHATSLPSEKEKSDAEASLGGTELLAIPPEKEGEGDRNGSQSVAKFDPSLSSATNGENFIAFSAHFGNEDHVVHMEEEEAGGSLRSHPAVKFTEVLSTESGKKNCCSRFVDNFPLLRFVASVIQLIIFLYILMEMILENSMWKEWDEWMGAFTEMPESDYICTVMFALMVCSCALFFLSKWCCFWFIQYKRKILVKLAHAEMHHRAKRVQAAQEGGMRRVPVANDSSHKGRKPDEANWGFSLTTPKAVSAAPKLSPFEIPQEKFQKNGYDSTIGGGGQREDSSNMSKSPFFPSTFVELVRGVHAIDHKQEETSNTTGEEFGVKSGKGDTSFQRDMKESVLNSLSHDVISSNEPEMMKKKISLEMESGSKVNILAIGGNKEEEIGDEEGVQCCLDICRKESHISRENEVNQISALNGGISEMGYSYNSSRRKVCENSLSNQGNQPLYPPADIGICYDGNQLGEEVYWKNIEDSHGFYVTGTYRKRGCVREFFHSLCTVPSIICISRILCILFSVILLLIMSISSLGHLVRSIVISPFGYAWEYSISMNNDFICTQVQIVGQCSGFTKLCNETEYPSKGDALNQMCPYCQADDQKLIASFTKTCSEVFEEKKKVMLIAYASSLCFSAFLAVVVIALHPLVLLVGAWVERNKKG